MKLLKVDIYLIKTCNYKKITTNSWKMKKKKEIPKNYKFITSKRKIQKGIVVIHELHNTAEIQQLSNNKN